jgi:hypothetical protein
MRTLLIFALVAVPAFADDPAAHSGVVKVRTGPAASDIALFVMAAIGIWLARRAMVRRAEKRRED